MMLYRAMVTLDNKPFQFQRAFIFNAMNTLVTLKMSMDSTGLGMQLAEEVERKYYSRVEPTVFTNAVKEHLAVTLKRVMESGVLLLPEDMELRRQIHSIKRVVLPGGRFRFDSEKNEKYHADKFWALALAVGRAFGGPSAPAVASSKSQIDQLNRRLPPTETF
jgi:phage FluMu gp28-like protein